MNSTHDSFIMAGSFFKIGYRNFIRHKLYSSILLIGLTLGIACISIITRFVFFELGFDTFHEHAKDIYRITGNEWVPTPAALAPAMKNYFPEIQQVTRIAKIDKVLMQHNRNAFYEEGTIFAEPSFFQIFSFRLLKGETALALDKPNMIFLTKETAQRYFGEDDPIGKQIIYNDKISLLVAGIVEKAPSNSHIQFDAIISLVTLRDISGADFLENTMNTSVYTYFQLRQGTKPEVITDKTDSFVRSYLGESQYDFLCHVDKSYIQYKVQPLLSVHLTNDLRADIGHNGSKTTVMIFAMLAFLILIIACINYINLAAARALSRLKETGIRKVLGSSRRQIIGQFTGESVLLSCVSLPLALLVVMCFTPALKDILRNTEFLAFNNWVYWLVLVVMTLLTGIVSGVYPALFLSRMNPVTILANFPNTMPRFRFRNILISFQFTVSIILIVAAIVISSQMNFVQQKHLNYPGDQMIIIPLRDSLINSKYGVLKQELRSAKSVISSTATSAIPGEIAFVTSFRWDDQKINDNTIAFLIVDKDFLTTYGIKLAAGRDFSEEFPSDKQQGYIINEAALERLRYSEGIGKPLTWMGRDQTGKIIGIVKNFAFKSIRNKVEPLVMYINDQQLAYLSVRINGDNVQGSLHDIQNIWKELFPGRPFEYSFLDKRYDAIYRSDKEALSLITMLSGIAVFISCLGLFGLVSLSAEQRTKEMGIRKVLGASVSEIVLMMTYEYSRWIFIAVLIAWPLGWYVMMQWLENFAYRIELKWWMFATATAIAVFIAVTLIVWRVVRVAKRNPVDSLRYE